MEPKCIQKKPKWSQSGAKLEAKCFQNLDQKSIRFSLTFGALHASKWSQNVTKMEPLPPPLPPLPPPPQRA